MGASLRPGTSEGQRGPPCTGVGQEPAFMGVHLEARTTGASLALGQAGSL